MDKDIIATLLRIYTLEAIDKFGTEAIVVLNG